MGPPPRRSSDSRRTGLSVVVTDGRGCRVTSGGLGRWLTRVAPRRARGTLSVAIVSDGVVRALNRRYRRRDYATDVLSFPSDSPTLFLGDVVIARGVARRQAKAAAHDEATEFRILALHGLLHLLGYDHHRDRKMAVLERRLRIKGGLRQGLIERSQP